MISISDPKKRFAIGKEAKENDWTSDELTARIRGKQSRQPPAPAQATLRNDPLSPSCGTPYSYQVVQRMNLKTGKSALRLDNHTYKLYKDTRLPKDRYPYWAEIEKVIDGDTVKVRFDLGFNTEIRQTLRLRGLDCAEMDTKEGQAAKTFLTRDDILKKSLYLNNLLLKEGYAERLEG